MSKIFISYRRDDSSTVAGRIYDRLASHFGRGAVFKDVDSIPLGVNFAQYIDGVIQQCAVTLVIIGPHWASALNRERLADPGDFVRQEVEAALNRKIPVIPVFVQGAAMPSNSDLPPSLNELAMRNGLPVRDDPDFDNDIRRVMTALERYVPPMRPSYSVAGPAYTATAPARPGTPAASGPTSYAPREPRLLCRRLHERRASPLAPSRRL